jgi:hypothetical protein
VKWKGNERLTASEDSNRHAIENATQMMPHGKKGRMHAGFRVARSAVHGVLNAAETSI